MFDWFSDLPGLVKVFIFILLAVGYLYGQIEGARAAMRAWSRRARNKKVTEWQQAYGAKIRGLGHGCKITFAEDNAVVLQPTYEVLAGNRQHRGYAITHEVMNATGRESIVAVETLDHPDLAKAERLYKELCGKWLSDAGRVDGSEIYK